MSNLDDQSPFGSGPELIPGAAMAAQMEEEGKAMKGGRGGLIAGAAIVAIGIVGLIVFALMGDGNEAYEALGRNANQAKTELFEGFWGCTFQGVEELESNEDLQREIHQRARQGRGRFGNHVRSQCAPKLEQLDTRLRALIPPEDMVIHINAMIAANESLRGGISDFTTYLDGVESYDEEDGRERVVRIARGWYEFKRASAALNSALRERLSSS